MALISIAMFVAVFAYILAPDHSPDANRMTLEIGGHKPGFHQSFLLIRKQRPVAAKSRITELFSGADDRYDYLPLRYSRTPGDSLVVNKFINQGIREQRSYFHPAADNRLLIKEKTFWLGTDRY